MQILYRWIGLAMLAMLLTACVGTTTRFDEPPTRYSGTKKIERVYVYSFLDTSTTQLGDEFVREFRRFLVERLSESGIAVEFRSYSESPVAIESFLPPGPTGNTQYTQRRIPVGRVIEKNAQGEADFGATHRLVVFPQWVSRYFPTSVSAGIQWDVYDRMSGALNWKTLTVTKHQDVMGVVETIPASAVAPLVDSVIASMKEQGALK